MRRLILVCLCLLVPSAGSSTAIWDFNDYPDGTYYEFDDPRNLLPQTFSYQCGDNPYCTYGEITSIENGNTIPISAERGGVRATFTRPGGIWDVWEPGALDKALTAGNGPEDLHLFVVDFDKSQSSFAAALGFSGDEAEYWTVVELWSRRGATGTLLNSALYADPLANSGLDLAISVPGGRKFRSVRFGKVWFEDPACRINCLSNGVEQWADDIRVWRNRQDAHVPPIPEPSGIGLFALGILITGPVFYRKR